MVNVKFELFRMCKWMPLHCAIICALLTVGCGLRQSTPVRSHPEPSYSKPQPSTRRSSPTQSASPVTSTASASERGSGGNESAIPGRPEVRPPAVAGQWYPSDRDELLNAVKGYLSKVTVKPSKKAPIALIVPHAGYVFSGQVAAYAYKMLEGHVYDVVVILGPSHYYPVQGAALPTARRFQTPLSEVEVDTALGERLLKICPLVYRNSLAHEREHDIECQLPFLHVVFLSSRAKSHAWKLLPLTMGDLSLEECQQLGRALASLLVGKRALLIASSDMSHYPKYADANRVDKEMLRALRTLDPKKVWQADQRLLKRGIRNLDCTLCGLCAVLTVLETARLLGATHVEVLKYANSGDVPEGDKSRVVGYCAVAIYGDKQSSKTNLRMERRRFPPSQAHIYPELSASARAELLRIAKLTIKAMVKERREPDIRIHSKELLQKWGAFVTIKKDGQLRGCIGVIEPIRPLWQQVMYAAASAALRDWRFPPVSPDELEELSIEISVLGRIEEIVDVNEIQVGKHGLIVIDGENSGLLLPQVATEYGWNREQFLEATCEKAGLPKDAWRTGARIFRFAAQVFGEDD